MSVLHWQHRSGNRFFGEECHAGKVENRQINREAESRAFPAAEAGRHVAGRLAGGAAAGVRQVAKVPREEPRRRADLLGVRGRQSRDPADLSGGDPRAGAGRELLLLPRLRRQHAGNLQAHRVRARSAGPPARAAKRALALGHQPRYSEVYLQYGAQREVVFRPGAECPPSLQKLARRVLRRPRPAEARGVCPVSRLLAQGHEQRARVPLL